MKTFKFTSMFCVLGTGRETSSAGEDGWCGQGWNAGQWQCAGCDLFVVGRRFTITGCQNVRLFFVLLEKRLYITSLLHHEYVTSSVFITTCQ